MMMPDILTYECTNAPTEKLRWLACFHGKARGEAIPMNFNGETEQEAIDKLTAWWHNINSVNPVVSQTAQDKADQIMSYVGRGQCFVGKVWVVNKDGGKRVMPEEVDSYLAQGYIRGKKWVA